MIVTVKCFTGMRRYAPADEIEGFELNLDSGARLSDLLARLGAAEEKAALTAVNGRNVGRDTVLQDGDRVVLFTPAEGG